MSAAPASASPSPTIGLLNRECFCISLDRAALHSALCRIADDPSFYDRFIATRPHLFSNTPVFVAASAIAEMMQVVRAIEAATRLEGYRDAALSWAPEVAKPDFGPRGAFMGYDFHLAADGPKLIEINTNAGGAILNMALAGAHRACCSDVAKAVGAYPEASLAADFQRMFAQEWSLQRTTAFPTRIAIVDDRPEEQFLLPEFILARRLFFENGIEAIIADPAELRYDGGRLLSGGDPIDLVYNRLVDFALDAPEHAALRTAYLDEAVVVTPNPRTHTLFADKRNLTLLSDQAALRSWGLPSELLAHLTAVPHTAAVTPQNAARLWESRNSLFFKPAGGHGSKAVYRGDKMTKTVWSAISHSGYVAQEFVAPSERIVDVDGVRMPRKVDIRLYVYDGRMLLSAARLYQGQTTNFRTPGGGFSPVITVPDDGIAECGTACQ